MLSEEVKKIITAHLDKHDGEPGTISNEKTAGGGSINECLIFLRQAQGPGQKKYFIKKNSSLKFPGMFKKECEGLEELKRSAGFHIPSPLLVFENRGEQYFVLEYLEKAPANASYYERAGAALAALHRVEEKQFGFKENNYIGSLVQENTFCKSWEEFFSEYRLQPLAAWCYDQKMLNKTNMNSFENLFKQLNSIFPNEKPALLHGDLWSGNAMNTTMGPSVYDPAVYYGHREMDLAMTRLFGGFEEAFYTAYENAYPPEKNYRKRTEICNLYPLLVHVKLFGHGYLNDVLSVIKRF